MSPFLPPPKVVKSDGTVIVSRWIPLVRPDAGATPGGVEERPARTCPNLTLGEVNLFQGPSESPADEVEP